MGLFEGCLLATDIDGTLLSSGFLPQANIEKIKYFISEGGNVALATGRTPGAVTPVIEKLGDIGPGVYGNGSMIYDFCKGEFLHCDNLPEPSKQFAADVMENMSGVGVEVHSGTDIFVLCETQETIDHKNYENIKVKCIDYKEILVYNWNKVNYMPERQEQIRGLRALALKYSEYADFVETNAVIDGRMRYYFEQIPKNTSKRSGLLRLCGLLGVKEGNFFAIGDYYNDLPMLEAADVSACPCDSPQEIVDATDVRVTTAENGAVADFIDYLTKQRKETENGRTD